MLNGQPQSPTTTGSIDTCGVFSDLNFGRPRAGTRLDDSILSGWGARPYDWQFGISVQQELMPRVSVEAGYYRRWWPIFTTADITDNINTTAADYARFSVYAPSDSRLPNGGGYAVPGIYNINAAPSLVVPSNVQKAANSLRVVHALLGWLRRHGAGASAQRGEPAGRHEHRTPGVRSVRAARRGAGKRR